LLKFAEVLGFPADKRPRDSPASDSRQGLSASAEILPGKGVPMKHAQRQGFTLVEMMLVISLVGVMAAMAAPPFFRYLASNRLATQADRMVADLQYARSLSVASSQILRFSATAAGYQLTNPVTGLLIRDSNFCAGLGLNLTQSADFYPWGMADPMVFTMSNPAGAKQITLMPTGLVEVH
jgi:prepilin-type N-terminal cleavage/methylation domain-containing protein